MASKEYRDNLKITDYEKYQRVYGTGLKNRYQKKLKETNPEKYRAIVSNSPKRKEANKRYKKNHPEKTALQKRKDALKSKYGITIEIFNHMVFKQSNCCKSCGNEFLNTKSMHIDHCHDTMKVRGILCVNCNVALGYAKNSIERLKSLIIYLQQNA